MPQPTQRTLSESRPPAAQARTPYEQELEAQLRALSDSVRTLESHLSGYAKRNQELEASHMRLAGYRAESERGVAERAAETIRIAEARAADLTAAAEDRAARLEREARNQAMDLIEAVGSEIDALEEQAQRLQAETAAAGGLPSIADTDAPDAQPGEAPRRPTLALAGSPAAAAAEDADVRAAAEEAALKRVRGEIGDLLKLREAILTNIRGAVEGFEHQLDELARPPLAVAGEAEAGVDPAAAPVADGGGTTAPAGESADGPLMVIETSPVDGVLEASRIEQELAAISADVHLRSVEGRSATLQIRGIPGEQLIAALETRFPGSSTEWDGDSIVRLSLPASDVGGEPAAPEKKSS